MRTRSRSPKKAKVEQAFPIRIRVKVPEDGYGQQYIEMQEWLSASGSFLQRFRNNGQHLGADHFVS